MLNYQEFSCRANENVNDKYAVLLVFEPLLWNSVQYFPGTLFIVIFIVICYLLLLCINVEKSIYCLYVCI